MSAKDDLTTYERDWQRHKLWRKPQACTVNPPGRYVQDGRTLTIELTDMPSDLRERVKRQLERTIYEVVDSIHANLHAEKRQRAFKEAQETIAELSKADPELAPYVEAQAAP